MKQQKKKKVNPVDDAFIKTHTHTEKYVGGDDAPRVVEICGWRKRVFFGKRRLKV